MEFLYYVIAFLVAISILIAVHEFGHFWVAKKLGVKVLRYSIGFGKPLLKIVRGEDKTEYVISALPLGGYVSMLGEQPEEPVAEQERHRAFNTQPIWKRFSIVAAGPIFNFIFAVLAFWLMFVIGSQAMKPIVGDVIDDSPAATAGLQRDMEIIAIDGEATPVWEVAINELLPALVDRNSVTITVRDADGLSSQHQLDLSGVTEELEPHNLFELLGFEMWRPHVEPVIGRIVEGSAAEQAGLQKGDRILRIDNQNIEHWGQMNRYVLRRPGESVTIEIQRGQDIVTRTVELQSIQHQGRTLGQLGVGSQTGGRIPESMVIYYRYSVWDAIGKSFTHTWDMSALTLKMLGKLVTGQVSLRNLSGPIDIARHAGVSASHGMYRFLGFLAIVSISLGILNLLPIPILDGGHLMFYIVEAIKGSPVSPETETTGRMIGVMILIMLMSLAFYNDIMRLFG